MFLFLRVRMSPAALAIGLITMAASPAEAPFLAENRTAIQAS
jgi:hypothetical protein